MLLVASYYMAHHLTMAKMVKQVVYEASGLTCSIGVSGDKTTAKYAAKLQKPNGLTVIHPSRAEQVLAKVPVTELCGIADGIGSFLASHHVFMCGDMVKIPKAVLQNKFGPLGERIWFMAQGLDPSKVEQKQEQPKSIGHGKVIPPNTVDKSLILQYFRYMSEKVAKRLRKHNLVAKKYYIALKVKDSKIKNGKISCKLKLEQYSSDGQAIYNLCIYLLENYWKGQGAWQVQVTALEPIIMGQQNDMFVDKESDNKNTILNNIIDAINQKFGDFTVQPGMLLDHKSMPNVIAPSWQPTGMRNHV